MMLRRGMFAAVLATALLAPLAAKAEPLVTNPFGNLTMKVTKEPSGTTPGTATLTIVTQNAAALTEDNPQIFFGLRLMGSEDVEMGTFRTTNASGGCIVSDFAGTNTDGWQGAPVFGASAPSLGSANSHMRMIGGFIKKSCGNIEINVSFRARPLVLYYAAFFGYNAAPWHRNHGSAPWNVVPTGGNAAYQEWWNLWGQFDTLGYSNACTNISGTTVSCG